MSQMKEPTTIVRKAGDRSITETVIFAVAEARSVNANELESPLYEVIDGEALEELMSEDSHRSAHATTEVEFEWAGCTVAAHSSGRVVVTVSADR